MSLNVITLKNTAIYSAIFGAGLGVCALIPALMPVISLFLLPFLSGIIVLLALKRLNPDALSGLSTRDFAILGGISGTICLAAFLIIFSPMVLILKILIKNYYTYGIDFLNFFLASVLIASIMLIFFATNAAGGLLAGFLFNWFNEKSG